MNFRWKLSFDVFIVLSCPWLDGAKYYSSLNYKFNSVESYYDIDSVAETARVLGAEIDDTKFIV